MKPDDRTNQEIFDAADLTKAEKINIFQDRAYDEAEREVAEEEGMLAAKSVKPSDDMSAHKALTALGGELETPTKQG